MDLASYISGFVDGEGCFCVSFQPSSRHRLGWEVRPSFSVSQNAERSRLLYELRRRWSCGTIRPDRSDKTIKFEVRNIRHLVERILPHFREYPLLSAKQGDLERFDRICLLVERGMHQEPDGLQRDRRARDADESIWKTKVLQQRDTQLAKSGEGIVCATG